MIADIVQIYLGVAVNPAESAVLYATSAILFVVVFDTMLDVFRMVANSIRSRM